MEMVPHDGTSAPKNRGRHHHPLHERTQPGWLVTGRELVLTRNRIGSHLDLGCPASVNICVEAARSAPPCSSGSRRCAFSTPSHPFSGRFLHCILQPGSWTASSLSSDLPGSERPAVAPQHTMTPPLCQCSQGPSQYMTFVF